MTASRPGTRRTAGCVGGLRPGVLPGGGVESAGRGDSVRTGRFVTRLICAGLTKRLAKELTPGVNTTRDGGGTMHVPAAIGGTAALAGDE
jgi:hypothetical protein